jgi:alkanesulfonate monooxygenase SsuD/methylene tetrahydromethanopterin reductase-like flavin-dependent oxidoreductase (luciferase family)
MTKLGICISPFMGLSLARLAEFAQESENAGMEGIFIPGGRNDGLLCCYTVAKATNRVMVATWIVNIFLREAALCSWAARQIAQETPGRFILGLGMSHRPLLESLGIRVSDPRERLRRYTHELRNYLGGQATSQPTMGGVPIYFTALALETVRLGAEIADGLMLDICTVNRLQRAAATACDTLNWNGRSRAQFTITTGIRFSCIRIVTWPWLQHNAHWRATLPCRRTIACFARSGFATEMAQLWAVRDSIEDASARITPAIVESVALIGPPTEWPARFEALGQAGADWVIVRPFPVDQDYEHSLHAAINAFARIE